MGISIFYLENFNISTNVCSGLDNKEFELIDFFSSTNPKLSELTVNKVTKFISATSNLLKSIKQNSNIFDNIHMLAGVGVNVKNNRIYQNTNSIKSLSTTLSNTDWEKSGLEAASKKASRKLAAYKELLSSSKVQFEVDRWNCFLLFLENLTLTDSDLSKFNVTTEIILQLEEKHLIERNNSDNGYILSIPNLNFKSDIIELYQLDTEYYNRVSVKLTDSKDLILQTVVDSGVLLEEFLTYNLRGIDIFERRLSGGTVQSIGNEFNISKQRVSQRISNIIKKLPKIQEIERYKDKFKKFKITKDDFLIIYNKDGRIWELLNLLYVPGKEHLAREIINGDYPKETKEYIIKKYNLVVTSGEVRTLNRNQLLFNVLNSHRNLQEYFSVQDIYYLYKEACQEHPKMKIKNLKSMEGILHRNDEIVFSSGKGYRLYTKKLSEEDLKEIFSIFESLPDGAYNADYIYRNFPKIMRKFDIRSGSELHYICKRQERNKVITFGRNPEFVKGKLDKKSYIFEQLKTYNGRNFDDFLNMMNCQYGLNSGSLKSYALANFKEYIVGNCIYIGCLGNSEILDEIRLDLTEKIYLKKDFEKILLKHLTKEEITTEFVFDLGFRMGSNLVYDSIYRNSAEAVKQQILSNKIFKMNQYSFTSTSAFYFAISELEKSFKILKISETDYIQVDFLEGRGFDKSQLAAFLTRVNGIILDNEYFSIFSLMRGGFTDQLLEYGFELITLDRLISISDKYKIVNNSFPHIFCKSDDKRNINHFLIDMLFEVGSVNLEDFVDDINQKFGVNLDEYNVRLRLQNEGAYYSQPLNKIYITKDDYLKEVYGE